jgi:DNA-binding NarL/FixJ family response regulator
MRVFGGFEPELRARGLLYARRMPPPRKAALALLSDHELFRQVVAQRLADQGFGPVLQLSTRDKLVAAVRRRRIDIAIVDIDHDSDDLIELARSLRAELPALHVIMLATPLRQTADDTIVLETGGVERAAAVTALVQGLRSTADDKSPHRHWSRITERQREVMRWLAIGMDNAAIGQKLRIGERAVKAHVSSLLGLFGLANRTQLALLADRAGLRPPTRR